MVTLQLPVLWQQNLSYLLVKNGYARAYTEVDCSLEDNLVKTEKIATNNYVGLWETLQPKEKPKIKLLPLSFTVKSGENITLTATLTSNGNPLANKKI